ncbi:hypothetical protein FHS85_001741 [Rhodoligotrophos appendicifer]|uniref:hypothetical protein n=1 Tax=Rhodoligotrophos appendicifer TaxID=987056 RepID=UPI0011872E8F|nr:hypothetical protein [Rhodoligotrophos appendicifer]
MTKVFMANGVTGKVAIYDGPSDAPFTDPLGNLDKLYFHSDLDYVSGLDKRTGTLNLPERRGSDISFRSGKWYEHTLFAHGRAGAPFCLGRVVDYEGADLPLVGSIPIQQCAFDTSASVGGEAGSWRFLHLATDGTNVMIIEYTFNLACTVGGCIVVPETSIDWEVVVTDKVLT